MTWPDAVAAVGISWAFAWLIVQIGRGRMVSR
jgi:hypothetical protein